MQSLHGITILDLTRLLPGPYATRLLADLGAEVIKIERPPRGDYARELPPLLALEDGRREGAIFAGLNRRKKSIGLDWTRARGREILLQLCARADVLIESFRPGALAAHDLDYAAARAHNPRLVYCSLSGYGQDGPLRDRAGHDLDYLALAGILRLNGPREGPPTPLPLQIADLAGGMNAALQILAALIEREQTGAGKFLDVALFDTALGWMQSVIGAEYRAVGLEPHRGTMPLAGAYPCYNVYATSDGEYMALGALEPKFWSAFCHGVERPEWVARQYDNGTVADVAALFRRQTRATWTEFSRGVDCCLEPLLTVGEARAHPQVRARQRADDSGHLPRLGEDTVSVLRELGMAPAEIEGLVREGVISS
jgi:crotonobetainyl-CoA:carnitine CoA-transferase CaiB-like acyl-CoA transferase